MKHRSDLINYLIQKNNFKRYLELGVSFGECIDLIDIEIKDGVDPMPNSDAVNYAMTSDEFFEQIPSTQKYDIIFIDGWHQFEQVIKDVNNSLDHLSESGIILLHDCNPESEELASRNPNGGAWTGDVWKAILHFRSSNSKINVNVVDTDYGVGIVTKGTQKLYSKPVKFDDLLECEYSVLANDRKNLLNLISVDEFTQLY
jgi:hypothetical protein